MSGIEPTMPFIELLAAFAAPLLEKTPTSGAGAASLIGFTVFGITIGATKRCVFNIRATTLRSVLAGGDDGMAGGGGGATSRLFN